MSTEWDDIQRRIGNLPPKEVEVTQEAITYLIDEAAAKVMDKINPEDHEDEDLLDDDRFMQEYRQKRMKEMQEKALKAKWGTVGEISKPQWQDEVTEASKSVHVIVHLYQPGIAACEVYEKAFRELARRHPDKKFLRIVANNAIENYPDSKVPTILIYKDTNVVAQYLGLTPFAGMRTTANDIEWVLSRKDILETDLEDDPRQGGERMNINVVRD